MTACTARIVDAGASVEDDGGAGEITMNDKPVYRPWLNRWLVAYAAIVASMLWWWL